jgi:hypothetical protein
MLCEVFGGHSLCRTTVFEWQLRFEAGQVPAEDDECSGQLSISKTTENVEQIQELIHKDCR